MSKTAAALTTFILLAGAVIAFVLWQDGNGLKLRLNQPAEQAPVAEAPAEEELHYPIEAEQAADAPLPALNESDPPVWNALGELIEPASVKQLFFPNSIVRRIVVTVDNLPREVVSDRLRPTRPAEGNLMVEGGHENLRIAPQNSARYTPFVRALQQVDAAAFSETYARFYPLFQAAYRDLGYPNGYFNDRLVAVIDHMLAAPEIEGPISIVQPHIFYKFADPKLESSSAGHKLMVRMGAENASRVKAKLREIRAQVTAGAIARPANGTN